MEKGVLALRVVARDHGAKRGLLQNLLELLVAPRHALRLETDIQVLVAQPTVGSSDASR